MIWTSDWCYYTITDGVRSIEECIPEPAEDGDATWDDESESDEGFRLPEIVITAGDEEDQEEIEQWEAEREEEYMSIE